MFRTVVVKEAHPALGKLVRRRTDIEVPALVLVGIATARAGEKYRTDLFARHHPAFNGEGAIGPQFENLVWIRFGPDAQTQG